jgi:hypothetical protein
MTTAKPVRTAGTLAGAFLAGLAGTGFSAAAGDDFGWLYSSKWQIAGTQKDDNRLTAECQDDEIIVVYQITRSNLAAELAKKKRAYLMVIVDEKSDGRGTFTSVNSNFIADTESVRIGFGGKGALRLAHEMSKAEHNIVVGVAIKDPTKSASYTKYNTTRYEDLADAGDAIESLFTECGDQ